MAQTNPGFEVVGGTETEVSKPAAPAPDNGVAIAMLTIGLKALSQRAVTAITDLFSLLTIASCFWLWYLTPKPDIYQITSLTLYGILILAINWIVRRK
jgi:hypothetical protein